MCKFKQSKVKLCTIIVTMFLFSILFNPIYIKAAKEVNSGTIYLKGIKINLQQGANSYEKFGTKNYTNDETGPYIVAFNGPVYDYYKSSIENAGAKLIEYIPDFSFLTLMTPETARKIKEFSFVNDVIIYQPIFKIDEFFMNDFGKIKNLGKIKVRIMTFDDSKVFDYKNLLENAQYNGKNITALINSTDILKLANSNYVKSIEPVPEFKLLNDVAKDYTGVQNIWNLGYTGDGQVVGIADTGLDTGKNDNSMHPDFQGRIDKIYALSNRGSADDPHGHGTHVAGSVLGNGVSSNGKIKGMAPNAHLVFQSILDRTGGLGGLPSNLNDLFSQAWNAGARIHTNSWGAAVNGAYDEASRQVDEYIWNNNMIILFAAGNEGQSKTGSIVYNSISSPGSAKNCITVGASENNRPEKGNYADNPNEIAAFSSRGNCKDGRLKPDIVAPGTWILSTKSSKAPISNFWGEYNDKYAYMGGTSMATPITAGAIATAREYMIKQWKHTPSPAMMKAALINGATNMGYGYMSRDQGWGRVNILDSLKTKEYKYLDQEKSLSTGQTASYTYSIESNKFPLKISLVWTDYPGSTSASKALVNDLDLKVTSPSGTVYYGNDFSQPFNSSFDRLNNVENVFIDNPEIGSYTVEVVAYNIPQGPQPFALFASGDFKDQSADTEAPKCSITSPANGSTVSGNVTISASASDNVGVTKVLFLLDGQILGEDTSAPYEIQWDTKTVSNGQHKLQAKAYDAAGNVGIDEITITVNNEETSETKYVTETYSDYVSFFYPYEKTINVTAPGKITINLTSSSKLSMKLYDPSGTVIASGTTSITYNAKSIGKYDIVVYSSSIFSKSFNLKVTYPVKVNQNIDKEAPKCSITSPAKGSTISGNITISASANDNVGVTKVQFLVDNKDIGEVLTAPYKIIWDTKTVSNGQHKLQVKAYDAVGNVGIDEITVTVNNEETPETKYVTETYSDYVTFLYPYIKTINATAPGKISIDLTGFSDLALKLYDSDGNVVAEGTNSITYNTLKPGKFHIEVSTAWYDYFTLKVTYPVNNK
ncbi:MAG: S8 family serine peptidase [Caloramator sp.]|nr:S8 family serine peptidase [Caloramator sp.]